MRATSVLWFVLAGCSSGDDKGAGPTGDTGTPPPMPTGLEIAGTWLDEFGTEHVIDEDTWTQTFPGYPAWTFEISAYDNVARVVIAQNGPQNPYSAGLWSRFDWAATGDGLFFCQSAFDAATEADAEATPRADDADPATGGCGGFPWTNLTP